MVKDRIEKRYLGRGFLAKVRDLGKRRDDALDGDEVGVEKRGEDGGNGALHVADTGP